MVTAINSLNSIRYFFIFSHTPFLHLSFIFPAMILPSLFIAPTTAMGRGVFTDIEIESGTVIEMAPVIVMSAADRQKLDETLLHDYIFEWGDERTSCCMALGYVAVYNHSYTSNCEYEMDFENDTITITTVRAIKAGEELFINYNGDWNDAKPVWFEDKKPEV